MRVQAFSAIRSCEDIEAFKRAVGLLPPVHRIALRLPEYERFGLASQIRRASKSVPTNIAEGYGKRRSVRNFTLYLGHALGSSNEMIVHLQITDASSMFSQETARILSSSIGRYVRCLCVSLRSGSDVIVPRTSYL